MIMDIYQRPTAYIMTTLIVGTGFAAIAAKLLGLF